MLLHFHFLGTIKAWIQPFFTDISQVAHLAAKYPVNCSTPSVSRFAEGPVIHDLLSYHSMSESDTELYIDLTHVRNG